MKSKTGIKGSHKKVTPAALAVVEDAISKLAFVRDALKGIEQGDTNGMGAQDYAFFIRAGMEEAASKLELALVRLGVMGSDRNWFNDEVRHG